MKQQFLIKSKLNYLQSDYCDYPHHKIHNFLLFNIIIFVSLISSYFSDERKIEIKINQNYNEEIQIINYHSKRNCPLKICENSNCAINDCKINLSEGSHTIVVEWEESYPLQDCSNMFEDKTSITEIDLSKFKANDVLYMGFMFKGCTSLQKVTLPRIQDNNLLRTERMFDGCISLTDVVFSNDFKVEYVENMTQMFQDCKSLRSINFPSNFKTSAATEIQDMFSGCHSLESLNFYILETHKVINMACLFKSTTLTSFNLGHFDTSQVTDTEYMFYNCSNLSSLNLSKFVYSKMTMMRYMLANNSKLELVDFGKNEIPENANTTNMFENSNQKMIIYVNKKNPEAFFGNYNKNFTIAECGNSRPEEIKNNYIENKIVCVENCSKLKNYKYKYMNVCLENCPSGTVTNEASYICEIIETISFTIPNPNIKTTSITISTNIPNIETTISINQITTTPLENPSTSKISSTSPELKTTVLKNPMTTTPLENPSTSKSSSTSPELKTTIPINQITTTLENPSTSQIPSTSPELTTTAIPEQISSTNSIEETEIKIIAKNETNMTNITKLCDTNEFFSGLCNNIYQREEDKDSFVQNIIGDIISGNLNEVLSSVVNEGKIITIEEDNSLYQISTITTQKNLENISSIDFGECEEILKNNYSLNLSEELIIFKIEHTYEGINIPIIEYALFSNNGSIPLDLTKCENYFLEYNTPVSLDSNEIYKHDLSSEYYSDKCNQYSSEDVDMTIYERKNEYNEKNMSLCEYNCTYIKYLVNTSKVQCKCAPKNDLLFNNNTKNKENKQLLSQVEAQKKNTNFDVTQCIDLITKKEGIVTNTAFYILLFIIAFFVIIGIIFCCKGYNDLKETIDEIIYKMFSEKKRKKTNKFRNKKNKEKNKGKNPPRKLKLNNSMKVKSSDKNNYYVGNKIMNRNMKKNNSRTINKNINNKNNNDISNNKNGSKSMSSMDTLNEDDSFSNDLFDNDYELNLLNFSEALKYDKREFREYYCSLICQKQIIVFSFFNIGDYTSGIIKKFIFFLSFALHYASNALFFNDNIMHQIYEDNGSYNFIYQLPFICYSFIISNVALRIIMETLVLVEKNILEIKRQKTRILAEEQKNKCLRCILIKYISFFALCSVLLIAFWIYLTCFSAVYQKTQIHLIKNTLISFGLSLIYPFLINLIPGIFRRDALASNPKKRSKTVKVNGIGIVSDKVLLKNREYVYKVSKFLQLL